MSEIDPHNEEHADGIVEDREQAPPVYFNILFYGLIIWAVIFMAWFLFSGWSSHDEFEQKMAEHTGKPVAEEPALSKTEGPAPPAPSKVEGSKVEGPAPSAIEGSEVEGSKTETPAVTASVDAAALYADKCAGCHGATGEGAFGPDLTASSYKYGRSPDKARQSIASGRPKSMPSFSSSLSGAEIDALTSYILEL